MKGYELVLPCELAEISRMVASGSLSYAGGRKVFRTIAELRYFAISTGWMESKTFVIQDKDGFYEFIGGI